MSSFGVVIMAFVTSVVTAATTVYVIEKKQLFRTYEVVPQTTVPDLKGLSETDARSNLRATGLVYLAAPREASSAVPAGMVLRQSLAPGQSVPREHPVTVVLADELPKVPDVVRLTQADASSKLEQAGYKVQVGPKTPSDSVPEGAVLAQSPAAGAALGKDQVVTLSVSAGGQLVEVPKVVGRNVNVVKTELEKLGFTVNVRWVSVAETATYIVLSQDPAPATQAKPGSTIQLSANR